MFINMSYNKLVNTILIFSQALEQVEYQEDRLMNMCKNQNLEEFRSFEQNCLNMLGRIEKVRNELDESYRSVRSHDTEHLKKFQVIKRYIKHFSFAHFFC